MIMRKLTFNSRKKFMEELSRYNHKVWTVTYYTYETKSGAKRYVVVATREPFDPSKES